MSTMYQDILAAIREALREWKHRRAVRAQRARHMSEPCPFDHH